MDIASIVNVLNTLSPVGLAGGLGYVIYLLVKGKTSSDGKLDVIKGNDLHELPTMAEDLRVMAATMQRIESKMNEEFGYLRGRFNGRDK